MDDVSIARLLKGKVFALTGAGISVASGLSTFRGPGGMYEGRNAYDLASPEGFAKDPAVVWNWYIARIREGINAKPNPAHIALANLESVAASVTIVTSNVDLLHENAGSSRVFKLHGNIMQTLCTRCQTVAPLKVKDLPSTCTADLLPTCPCGGLLRPNIVWFGESPWPDALRSVNFEMTESDIVLEIGTSGVVSYGFTQMAVRWKIPVVRINPDPVKEPGVFCIAEGSETALPRLVGLAMGGKT